MLARSPLAPHSNTILYTVYSSLSVANIIIDRHQMTADPFRDLLKIEWGEAWLLSGQSVSIMLRQNLVLRSCLMVVVVKSLLWVIELLVGLRRVDSEQELPTVDDFF